MASTQAQLKPRGCSKRGSVKSAQCNSCNQASGRQLPLCFDSRHASCSCSSDCLRVYMVLRVARGKYQGHTGARGPRFNFDVAIIMQLQLPFEKGCIGSMPHSKK